MLGGNVILRGATSLTKQLLTTSAHSAEAIPLLPHKKKTDTCGQPTWVASVCSSPEQLAGDVRF